MTKILITFLILASSFPLLSSRVYAQNDAGASNPTTGILQDITDFNPLQRNISTPHQLINNLLPFALVMAGLILFGMLIMGGFEMMTAAGDAKKADGGKTRITQAVMGFIIVFAAYWIAQILEIILGVNILR